MANAREGSKAAVLQALLPQLEAEGFEVFLSPSSTMLPAFLHAARPDAIAFKGDRKIAIEVVASSGNAESKLKRLRDLVAEHPDWELRAIYASPRVPEQSVPIQKRNVIEDQLDRIMQTFDVIGPAASLLIAWSVFEATARSAMPENLGRPQTPAHLLELLAPDGSITADEADVLRRLGHLRNAAAHGHLDVTANREDVEKLVNVTRVLLGSRK